MRAVLSVVIPTLNALDDLPGCLAGLMEGLHAGVIREVIISDGGSTDETRAVARAVGAISITGAPSRGGQLARGVAQAKGDWIMVLHADTVLPQGWPEIVLDHIERGETHAAVFRLTFDARGIAPVLVAGWANLRSRLLGLPYGDQGLIISRVLYDAVGGFADIPLMEDVAIVQAIGRARLAILPLSVRTSAAKYARAGYLRRGGRNLWTLVRYFAGTDPALLARAYRR